MKGLFIMIVALASFGRCFADPLMVTDSALLKTATEQLAILQKQYNSLESQLEAIRQLKDFHSGHYNYGVLNNSSADLTERQWSPSDWKDALQNIAGGNPRRYAELVKAYEDQYPMADTDLFTKSQAAIYQQSRSVNQAVTIGSTYAYNDIKKHLQTLYDLSSQIEQAPNTKAILDLNARLLTEIAYIQTQNLKVQTLISQQIAQNSANDLAEDGQSALFNRLSEK